MTWRTVSLSLKHWVELFIVLGVTACLPYYPTAGDVIILNYCVCTYLVKINFKNPIALSCFVNFLFCCLGKTTFITHVLGIDCLH